MKMLPILLLLLVGTAQVGQPQAPNDRNSLELGSVTVSLGMPKAEVLRRFADAGTKVTDLGDMVFADLGLSPHKTAARLVDRSGVEIGA